MKQILTLSCLAALASSASAAVFGVGGAFEQFHHIDTDNNGNIYVLGLATTPPGTDLLAASFKVGGALRWSRTFDGGFSAAENTRSIGVYNANVSVGYETNGSIGSQVLSRTTGALGVQTTFTPASSYTLIGSRYAAGNALFTGRTDSGGITQALMLTMDGVNPAVATSYGTFGYTYFVDTVSNLAGAYVAGVDNLGNFVAKWDFVTGTTVWKTNLPAGVMPRKVLADAAGNLYVGGQVRNSTWDLTVCKYSPAGAFLGQGIADSGSDDIATDLALAGNKPAVAGYQITAGASTLTAAAFQSNLTLGYHFIDPGTNNPTGLTADATNFYVVAGRTGSDSQLYKFGTAGSYWTVPVNIGAGQDVAHGLNFKSGMLLVCGTSNSDAYLSRIDTILGGILW